MDKQSIASSYINDCKKRYDFTYPRNRRTAVIGSNGADNIGNDIVNRVIDCTPVYDRGQINFSTYDSLILCNGYTYQDWFENCPEEKIDEMIQSNFTASVKYAQQFVKQTVNYSVKKKIIFIGSMAYKNVLNGSSIYCSTKAALAMLTRCLAWELAPKAYDVYCVNPSNTENTPMAEETIKGLMRYRNLNREEAEKYWSASLPKQNWLQSKDISNVINFLLSPAAEYMSGANIDLAGGQR